VLRLLFSDFGDSPDSAYNPCIREILMRRTPILALFAIACLAVLGWAQLRPERQRPNPRLEAQASPEQMKKIVHRVFEDLFNSGRYEAISEIYAGNCVVHEANKSVPIAHSIAEGKNFRSAAPDLRMTPGQMTVQGDIVTVSWTSRGSHTGRANGLMRPTGKHFQVSGTSRFRIENGKIVEIWNNWDRNDLFRQIGVSPAAAYLYDKAEDILLAYEWALPRGWS
jgi:predicted ester cyclase